ncbi:GGDEF domain-containing protein [Silanimonas algicola]
MNDLLARVADTLARSNGLESLTRPLLELLEQVSGLESTYLTTIDDAAGSQHLRFARNAGDLTIPEGIEVPWSDALCQRAIAQNIAYTDDVPGLWGDSAAARELGITTYTTTPVRGQDGQLLGTLCAASREKRPLAPGTRDVLDMFSRVIAQQMELEALLRRLHAANEELTTQASTDALTGLHNRRAIRDALAERLRRADVTGRQIHVGFVDLDGFKAINDTHGHDAGDQFLAAIATRLLASMRPGDIVGRYGGDEFVVVFDAPADGGSTAQHLRERLEASTRGRFELGGAGIDYAGASVGVISSVAGDTDIDGLVARADAAMYARKQARRETR